MSTTKQIGVDKFVKTRRLTNITGLCLCAVIIAMIGSLVWYSNGIYRDVANANQTLLGISGQQTALSGTYLNLYQGNNIKLAEATEKLNIAVQLT